MALEIITREELDKFKTELIHELTLIFNSAKKTQKEWLKSHEVRDMLDISPGTLQHLRVTSILPYTKIGGTIYYKYNDVLNMLEENKKR
jgi:hypothetical protein